MATQKKSKQPTLKQQIQQQIVNYQVQQAFGGQNQQNGIQQLQAEYNNWNAMQNLQSEYDSWLKAQQPKAPKTESIKFATASERKAQKELQTQKLPTGLDNPDNSFENTYGKKHKEGLLRKKEIAARNEARKIMRGEIPSPNVDTNTNQSPIPSLSNYINAAETKDEKKKSYMDLYTEQSLKKAEQDETVRQAREKTNAQRIADTMFDVSGANQQNDLSLAMPSYEPKQTKEPEEAVDNRTEDEKISQWLDPNYKLNDKEKAEAREIAQARLAKYNKINGIPDLSSPEETADYSNMVNLLNKTSKFANTMQGVINPYYNLGKYVANGVNSLRQTLFPNKEAQDNFNAAEDAFRLANQNAEGQDPINYNVGKLAGNISQYALTNPMFDALGKAAGAGKVGQFVLNQVGQNAQDLVLDTLPTLGEYKSDGELTDEEKKNLLQGIGINAAGNLVMGGLGAGIDALKARKAAKIPGVEDIDNVVRNTANIDDLTKQIPQIEDPVDSINSQFTDLMRQYNAETPSMRNIYTADDLSESMDNQFSELMKQRPENTIPNLAELQELEREARQMDDVEDLSNIWANVDTKGPRPYAKNQGVSPSIENAAEDLANQMKNVDLPLDVQDQLTSDFLDMYRMMDDMQSAAEATGNPKVMERFRRLQDSLNDLEKKAFRSDNLEEVNAAKKAADASRQAFTREIKKLEPNYRPELTGTRIGNVEYRRKSLELQKKEAEELANSFIGSENWLNDKTPGSNPLQFFADGTPKEQWKTSKFRTNTAEKLGWGDSMPEKNYAYRVYSEAEQNADALARYQNSKDVAQDLLWRDYGDFDEVDVKAAFNEMRRLEDMGDIQSLRLADRIGQKTAAVQREGGRIVQASAEYTRNTLAGALTDAHSTQDDLVLNPWKSRNKTKAEGNSRIARALADMGNKWKVGKNAPELTHDQIKKGVIAELEREVGSVETHFNDNDIEFLTQLAEDKSIPVWQITSEIEHKLNTGSWYTLDESVPIPRPTNRKLQNALNSLVTEEIRAEKVPPTLDEIVDQVRNTLGKESADLEGLFNDDDINYLANLINEGAAKEEIANALDLKMATGSWGISDETLQQVNDIFKQISHYDPNSKQFVEGQAEAYRLLANEIVPNATAMEKFEAWRYLAMLGNPKTWIRNYVGNKTFSAVTGISNNIAAVAEAGIDKGIKALGGEGIQRTKSVLNPISDNSLIKACAEDADASRYRQIIGSKYEKMDKSALRQSKSVFNSKLAQFYEKVTDAGISDYKAVKKKFSTSLAGYLKANGYDTNIFKAEDELLRLKNLSKTQLLSSAEKAQMDSLTKEVSELNKARDFALKQAEYATFHEDNAIASVLSNWSKTSKEKGHGIGSMFIEGVVPFKKTPANVLRSGLEYSPLGAIDSIRKTGKLVYENTGKRAGNLADVYKNSKGKDVAKTLAADVIDSWAKTLTGTGLTALGFYLYNKGIINSSDPDTKYQDQLEGHQNYSIEINGKSYTIDWAAPTVMPLMVGAEAAKLWNTTGKGDEDFYNNIDDYVAAANRIADPLVETSMMSGIKDTLETAANAAQYNETVNIPTLLAYNTATGYATQGIPTLAGQIARTIDPTRRSTYTDKEGVAGVLDRQLKKQINKTPGLSMLNEPYVDTYGREQQNSPFNNIPANLAYQMLSPGYLSNINETDADRVSREAFAVNQNANTLPKWQSSIKLDGQRVSPEDYTAASRVYGQTQFDVRNALANDEWFNSLDGPAKEEIVSKINTMSEHVGKSAIDPEYESNSKPYNAYKTGGIPGLMDYFKEETDKSLAKGVLDGTDIKTNSNAGKAVVEAVSSGNMAQAEQIAKTEQAKLDAFDSAGVKKTQNSEKVYEAYGTEGLKQYKSFVDAYGSSNAYNAYSRYQRAKQQIPGLSATTFKSTYNRIDSFGDSNGSVTQQEMLEYLNSGDFTQEEANQLWSAYGNEWKKSVKKNKKGNWATSK